MVIILKIGSYIHRVLVPYKLLLVVVLSIVYLCLDNVAAVIYKRFDVAVACTYLGYHVLYLRLKVRCGCIRNLL